jgi:hypothetical protein
MCLKKIVFLFLLIGGPLSIFAQKKQKDNPYRRAYREAEPIAFRLSGVASLNDIYGGKFAVDFPLKIIERRGLSGVSGGRNFAENYATLELGLFHKTAAFDDLTAGLEWTHRRVTNNGYFLQLTPFSVSTHRVSLPFGDSIPQPSSGLKPHPLTDRQWYVAPSVSIGFGRDFAVKRRSWRGIPLILMGKVGVTSLLPYKTFGYIIPTAELSLGYRFQGISIAARQIRKD